MVKPRDIRAILARLKTDDLFAQREALDDLVRLGDEAIPGLLVVLHTRGSNVRDAAAWSLGEIGDPLAVPGLINALDMEQDPDVRDAITWALQLIEDTRAVPDLLAALQNPSESARDSVAEALGTLNSEACVQGLRQTMHANNEAIRQSAAWALAQICNAPPTIEEFHQIVETLSDHLNDSDGKVRWVCVNGMYDASFDYGQHMTPAVTPLINRLNDCFESPWGAPERVCDVAANTLRNINTPEARAALSQWLNNA